MSWPRVKLSDVATINPRSPRDVDESQQVTFVAMASASEDGHLLASETRILSEAKKGFTYFNRDDVLLAKITPCFENGKCLRPGQIPTEIGFGSTEFHVIRPDSERLDGLYLFYLIWSEQFRFLGETSMSGAAGQKRVGSDFVKGFEIPLPPLSEQKRIAAILDKADAIRRKRQQAIQLADDFLRAVFLRMFGDPVTNPKGWKVKSLKELTTKIGSGSTPRGGSESYQDQGISLIRSLNIHDDDFRIKDLAFIDDEQAEKLSNVVVENGDVLLNITGASVCRCAVVPEAILPARVNQHVCIIRPFGDVRSEYLLHLLISTPYKQKLLKMSGAGATREALTKQQVEMLEIPVPPIELQLRFEGIKAKVRKATCLTDRFNESPFFESFSNQAFSGQL